MPNRNINSLTMRMECKSRSSLSYVKKSTSIHLNVGLLSLLPPTTHFEHLFLNAVLVLWGVTPVFLLF